MSGRVYKGPVQSLSPVAQLRPDGGMMQKGVPHKRDEVTAAMVERLRAAGLAKEQVAKILGMKSETLKRYYDDEMGAGDASLVAKIASNMALIAQDPNHRQAVIAGKFMLSRLVPEVFSERQQIQLLDKDGRPISPNNTKTLDPYQLSDEQRAALREAVTDVLREAVDNVNEYREAQVPEAEYLQIEDGSDEAEYEEEEDEE